MATKTVDMIAQKMTQVCEKHRVIRVQLFGSSVSGNDRPDRDVDLLVDYEENYTPTFFDLEKLQEALSPLFNGRAIDLMRPSDVHWFIRRSVLNSARTLYER